MSAGRVIITDTEARRIAAISALMQSDQDGEALAAARKLVAALDRHGLRIAEVLMRALAPSPRMTLSYAEHQRQAAELFAAMAMAPDCWTEKEHKFVGDMRTVREPSEAQLAWLAALLEAVADREAAC